MHVSQARIELSQLDEARFGFRTARAINVREADLPRIEHFCQEYDIRFCIARCAAEDLGAAQALEHAGFRLMDTLVYYQRDLRRTPIPGDTGHILIRPALAEDEAAVVAVAVESFQGYRGHYHADPLLDRDKCDEVYTSWAERSVASREVADQVLVAELDGRIAGFATLRLNSPDEGEGVLFGVARFAQGRGIYRSFMLRAMDWCAEQGRQVMIVSTQVTNIAVQKVWARLGFEPSHAYYTFHKWFEP